MWLLSGPLPLLPLLLPEVRAVSRRRERRRRKRGGANGRGEQEGGKDEVDGNIRWIRV